MTMVIVFIQKTSDPESEYHREDGPAIEWASGDKDWYYHGEKIFVNNQEDFDKYLKTHKR